MAYNNSHQGSYDQYSAFADGQVFLDEEGNAVYQLRPDGSPHFLPAGDHSPYQGAQSPGVYSPGHDLGKLEDYGPLSAEDDEDTIPYLQVVVPSTQSAPIDARPMTAASRTTSRSPFGSMNTNQYWITMLAANNGTACSPFSSLPQHAAFLNDPGHSAQASNHHMEQLQAVSHSVATPTSEVGVQLIGTSSKEDEKFPIPRKYTTRSAEQRRSAAEEKKRKANYIAVRKNRVNASKRLPALLQRLFRLEKEKAHVEKKFNIFVSSTDVGLPAGYGDLKFIPTTSEEKKL